MSLRELPEELVMKLVLVESPYAGDIVANVTYARRALKDCFSRDEAPFASHLLYTQEGVLDDRVQEERALGIEAGLAWGAHASKSVFYLDRGMSGGMKFGLQKAVGCGRLCEARFLDKKDTNLSLNLFYELHGVLCRIRDADDQGLKDYASTLHDLRRILVERLSLAILDAR